MQWLMLVLFFKIFICSILSDSMAAKTLEDFNYKFNDKGKNELLIKGS